MPDTSTGLLSSVRDRGNSRAWTRFASLYSPLLHAWLRRYGVPTQDVDDLSQEILLAVAREMPGFYYDRCKGSFRGWLRTVLVHRLRAYRRSCRAGGADEDTNAIELLDQLEDPRADLSRAWDREHDQHVIRRLLELVRDDFEPATWEAFRRVVLEEEPAADVAAGLGISLDALYAARYRVFRRLRQEAGQLLD